MNIYKRVENPILHIKIKDNCTETYILNIITLIKSNEYNFIIFEFENYFNSELFISKLQKINFENKIIITNKFYDLFKSFSVFKFLYINVEEMIFIDNWGNFDVVFLDFSSVEYLNFDWSILRNIQNINKNIEFFVHIDRCLSEFYEIIDILIDNEFGFSLTTIYKDVNNVRKHPCNAYMCNGKSCHSNKSKYPRYIFVNDRGIFPYMCFSNQLNIFENISYKLFESVDSVFLDYKNRKGYSRFLECNNFIFENYVITEFHRILPWNILFRMYMKESLC